MKNSTIITLVVLALLLIAPGAAQGSGSPAAPAAQAPDPLAAALMQWTQVNVPGFGNPNNAAVPAIEVFNGQLYASTQSDPGATIWRYGGGTSWTAVTAPGIDNAQQNGVVFDMIVFGNHLFAGTGGWGTIINQAHVYRSIDGNTWEPISGGWSADTYNRGITNFAVYQNQLYAATRNTLNGLEIWRSATGNSNDWQRMVINSLGQGANYFDTTGLIVFGPYLYAAVESVTKAGAQVWRTDGTTWTPVYTFGDANNSQTGGMAVFGGYLYVGTYNTVTGGQIWRSADGLAWSPVMQNGFGSVANRKIEGLVAVPGFLFAFTDNDVTGTQVFFSRNGVNWQPANVPGFGNAANKGVSLWSNGAATFGSDLFLGTFNQTGGQVWSSPLPLVLPPRVYLPLISR